MYLVVGGHVTTTKIEDKLKSFIAKNKFSDEAWQERGLMLSPKATIDLMVEAINSITNKVFYVYREGNPKNQ